LDWRWLRARRLEFTPVRGGNFYDKTNQKIAPSLSGDEQGSNADFCVNCSPERDLHTTQKSALKPFLLPLIDSCLIYLKTFLGIKYWCR
jgi:hypothetical protein